MSLKYIIYYYYLTFKKGLSTTQCTHSLLEIVDYYNYNKSDVFVLMLDASKAFDGVWYCKLLMKF